MIHYENTPGWKAFLHLCTKINSVEQCNDFFDLFMTPEERDGFAKRYLIIKELLLEQKTQREIAKDNNVSIAKITRGSNGLKNSKESLRKFIIKNIM